MTELRKASPLSAYVIAPGISAEEAAETGLIQVETDHNGNAVFGRYLTEEDEAPKVKPVKKGK